MISRPFSRPSLFVKSAVALACSLVAAGCAVDPRTGQPSFKETFNSDDPCSHNARNIGIAAGVLAGAIIGSRVDKKTGALVGAGIGGLLGGLIGADMDRRKCELSKVAKQYKLDMAVSEIKVEGDNPVGANSNGKAEVEAAGLSVSLTDSDSSGHFVSGSDKLTPVAKEYFSKIATAYSYTQQKSRLSANASPEDKQAVEALKNKHILVIGHTDDTGSTRLNADLSERRAQTVARIFQEAGVPAGQLFFQGAGETFPVADNRTVEGRAKNRRVEIVDLNEKTSFDNYLANRKPVVAYYRPVSSGEVGTVETPSVADANVPLKRKVAASSVPASRVKAKDAAKEAKAPSATDTLTPAVAPATQQATVSSSVLAIDFGGEPAANHPRPVDIGNLSVNKSFSLIPSAYASVDSPVANCMQDRPRAGNGVKALSDGREYRTSDYLPGLYDTSWAGMVNGHLVAFTHVAVLRDGGSPARKPQLLLYRDYKVGDKNAKPNYSDSPEVNAYRGDKALLYRVFASGPVRCVDIVIANGNAREAPGSTLYYERGRTVYSAGYAPTLAK